MKTLRFLLEKEFRQIFRDPAILRIMLIMPVIQLLILPQVANYEVKHVKLAVVDHDKSTWSNQLVHTITASSSFTLTGYFDSYTYALAQIENDNAEIIVEIPVGFEKNLVRQNQINLFIAVNAIAGAKANIGAAYLQNIISQYNQDIRVQLSSATATDASPPIAITSSNWFNPHLNYQLFMVPGILVILITMVGSFLAALNIVKEKEIGTIEQINVTPIRKHHFILGKLIPFWLMGNVVLTIGLLISRLVYGIAPVGNIGILYLFAGVFLLAVLGLGLLVSVYSNTQQQAMLISFFLMMVFILLGGLYTSIDSMPYWAQWITKFNPVSYFIEVMRLVVMKGSKLIDILPHIGIMAGFAVCFNSWAILSYRKRA